MTLLKRRFGCIIYSFRLLATTIPNAPGAIETVSYSCSREKTSKFDINDMDIAMNGCDLPVPNDGL